MYMRLSILYQHKENEKRATNLWQTIETQVEFMLENLQLFFDMVLWLMFLCFSKFKIATKPLNAQRKRKLYKVLTKPNQLIWCLMIL